MTSTSHWSTARSVTEAHAGMLRRPACMPRWRASAPAAAAGPRRPPVAPPARAPAARPPRRARCAHAPAVSVTVVPPVRAFGSRCVKGTRVTGSLIGSLCWQRRRSATPRARTRSSLASLRCASEQGPLCTWNQRPRAPCKGPALHAHAHRGCPRDCPRTAPRPRTQASH